MNKDGTLNSNAGKFQNLDRYEARKKIIKELDNIGLLTKIEDYKHTVPFSDRGKVPIEPLLSTQWFLKWMISHKDVLMKLILKNHRLFPHAGRKFIRIG